MISIKNKTDVTVGALIALEVSHRPLTIYFPNTKIA